MNNVTNFMHDSNGAYVNAKPGWGGACFGLSFKWCTLRARGINPTPSHFASNQASVINVQQKYINAYGELERHYRSTNRKDKACFSKGVEAFFCLYLARNQHQNMSASKVDSWFTTNNTYNYWSGGLAYPQKPFVAMLGFNFVDRYQRQLAHSVAFDSNYNFFDSNQGQRQSNLIEIVLNIPKFYRGVNSVTYTYFYL